MAPSFHIGSFLGGETVFATCAPGATWFDHLRPAFHNMAGFTSHVREVRKTIPAQLVDRVRVEQMAVVAPLR
jgi:hypothetical protein